MAEGVDDRSHLVVFLAHLLKPSVLLKLLRRQAGLVLGGAVDVDGATAATVLALQLDLVGRDIRDSLLGLAERQAGDVILVLALAVVAALLALPDVDAAGALAGGVDVVVVARVLGGVVVLRVGSLGLRDLHGAGALLLGEVEVRLVPLDAGVGLFGRVGDGRGARALATRADGPSGGRGAAVACIDLSILDGDLLVAEGGIWRGWVDGMAVGSDGGRGNGWRAAVVGGVLEDALWALGVGRRRGVRDGIGYLDDLGHGCGCGCV